MKPTIKLYHNSNNEPVKYFISDELNYNFNLVTGYFERWGKTYKDDPIFSKFGPEILDIEISTKCGMGCKYCYKSNTPKGINMSFNTFKKILDKFPKYNGQHFLCQIAYGVGDIHLCSELWEMMEYSRANNIVPNITINGTNLTDDITQKLVSYCGAVSVSKYDKDICYNAIDKLDKAGLDQKNIHIMLSQETYNDCLETIEDVKNDSRLKNINALVFLSLKQKGRGEHFTPVTPEQFKTIVEKSVEYGVPFGFDSCGAGKVIEVSKEIGTYDQWIQQIEPCESGLFSSFIDVNGFYYPCSFADKCTTGIDVTKVESFLKDVWENKLTKTERCRILGNGRSCPYFNIGGV